jgi:hypothetical protein
MIFGYFHEKLPAKAGKNISRIFHEMAELLKLRSIPNFNMRTNFINLNFGGDAQDRTTFLNLFDGLRQVFETGNGQEEGDPERR